jgi:hypothetical protein
MELFGVDILKILTIDLVHVLTIGVLGGVLLHHATKYLYFQNRSYQKVITIMIIGCGLFFIFDFIPVFGVGFGHFGFWFLIKVIYNETWAAAATAWFLSIFIAFMISLVILLLFGIEIIFMPNLLS